MVLVVLLEDISLLILVVFTKKYYLCTVLVVFTEKYYLCTVAPYMKVLRKTTKKDS